MDKRAVTPVIGIILMVAITVILATVVAAFVLSLDEETEDPPRIAQSDSTVVSHASDGNGTVTISHHSGDWVPVSDLEILIRACDERARLVDLPSDGRFDESIAEKNVNGTEDLVVTEEVVGEPGHAGDLIGTDGHSNTFEAGTDIWFRINENRCELTEGDEVNVQILHLPSESIILDKDLSV